MRLLCVKEGRLKIFCTSRPEQMSKSEQPREDFLEEDPEVPGQKFCLLSFLSPEKVLAEKSIFMFDRFLQTYEFASRTKNLEAYLMQTIKGINDKLDAESDRLTALDLSGAAEVCRSSRIRMDTLMDEFHGFVKKNERELRESGLKESYDEFMHVNKAKLEDEFFAKNEFRTTVRGLKVRGVYGTQGEAVSRSKKLQRTDPLHNIFVGEVGKWLPWDPEPSDVAEQEYAEEQLNTLMKKYKENVEDREAYQREQRERARKGGAAAAAGSKPGISIVRDSDVTGADVSSAMSGAPLESSVADMFGSSGPADMVIARKMERAAAAADTVKKED